MKRKPKSELDSKAYQIIKRYRTDYRLFAKHHLKIRPKDPRTPLVPMVLNKSQLYAHNIIEEQRKKTGKVRVLILKGRQQGFSTYIGSRFYHRASMNKSVFVYILTHEQPASDSLFEMVERFHLNNELRPSTGTSNVKVMEFDKLGSQYIVATAGGKAGGRSRTITLFHGSEVAFWPNAEEHFAASVQTVPDMPGTEIMLETTSAGPQGKFYEMWQDAEAGLNDYIAIFVPWFWQDEYRKPVPPGFKLGDEKDDTGITEAEYMQLYGLDLEQMSWRRSKIADLGEEKFRREYPATANEAFYAGSESSFIKPASVVRARKNKDKKGYGPLIMGGDPAGAGGDRFAVAYRRGFAVEKVEYRNKIEPNEAVEWLKSLIDEHDPALFNIDAGGIGAAIISLLKAKGDKYARVVKGINFGAKSQFKTGRPKVPGPVNRRAEMWERSRDWLGSEEGVSIPDLDELQADATAPNVKPKPNNDFLLESKEDMRKRNVRSPDLWDAIALTFADLSPIKNFSDRRVKEKNAGEPDSHERQKVRRGRRKRKFLQGSPNGWMGM